MGGDISGLENGRKGRFLLKSERGQRSSRKEDEPRQSVAQPGTSSW